MSERELGFPDSPRVVVVILNWNNWRDTLECLESFYDINYPDYEIIVVDNGSQNESVEKIREYARGRIRVTSRFFSYNSKKQPIDVVEYKRYELERALDGRLDLCKPGGSNCCRKILLILNESNFGFAEGNNIAIRFALKTLKPSYFLLVNNDVVVDRQSLAELVQIGNGSKSTGIVGPKIYYYDFHGRSDVINSAGEDIVTWKGKGIRYGFNEVDNGQHDCGRTVDKIDGACMLIKSDVFNTVGYFDPDYFAYWEETDFCFRASRKGYRIVFSPKAKVWHKVAFSSGGLLSPLRDYYITRNTFVFVKKNAKGSEKAEFLGYFLLFEFWLLCLSHLRHWNCETFKSFVLGVIDGMTCFISRKRTCK